jgi:Rieske Fe-S protein
VVSSVDRDHLAVQPCVGRRELVLGGAASLVAPVAARAAEPNERRPKAGDLLVHSQGPKKGRPLEVDDLVLGGPSLLAFPMDPSGLVLDGSRFNEVVAVRLAPDELDADTRRGAAEGIVVYSSICSHEACPVNMWNDHEKMLVCSCHGSMYDPRQRAEVVFGPAPRRLAQLPVRLVETRLVAAGPFEGRIGIYRPG